MAAAVRGRGASVVEHGRAALAGAQPALRSGGRVKRVSTCSMGPLRAVEVAHHRGIGVELQAWWSRLRVGAGTHSGDRGVGSALADARRRLRPLQHCLLPAVAMESVETFL